MTHLAISLLLASACAAVSAITNDPSSRPALVKNLVVFGDSYSDDCNYWRISNPPDVVAPFPFPKCPPPPTGTRGDGGHAWTEIIRNTTNIRVINLAYSGATCNNTDFPQTHEGSFNGTIVDPDVSSQIQQYVGLNDPSIKSPKDTVAAIFIGTNDLGFFMQLFRSNQTNEILPPGVHITNEASCVVKQIRTLYNLGLRRFVVFQNIPLEFVAQYSFDVDNGHAQPGAFLSAFMAQLVSANNALQGIELTALQGNLKGSDIQIFPTYEFYARRIANPKAFLGPNGTSTGFCNTSTGTCPNPLDFLWWDDLHPGLAANQQLARAVVAFVNGEKDVTGPGI